MPSIWKTSCLMVLRLMITMTDMILGNMKNVFSSFYPKGDRQIVADDPESNFTQSNHNGTRHSTILEAYNQRTNLAKYLQVNDHVSNLMPFPKTDTSKVDVKVEQSGVPTMTKFSELKACRHSYCGSKDNELPLQSKYKTCSVCGHTFPDDSTKKAPIELPCDEKLVQLEPQRTIEFREIDASKINRPDSSIKAPATFTKPFSLGIKTRYIELENARKSTKSTQTISMTDSSLTRGDLCAPGFVSKVDEGDKGFSLISDFSEGKVPLFKDSQRSLLKMPEAMNIKCDDLVSKTSLYMKAVLKNTTVQQSDNSGPLSKVESNTCSSNLDSKLGNECRDLGRSKVVTLVSNSATTELSDSRTYSPIETKNLMVKLIDLNNVENPISASCESTSLHDEYESLSKTQTDVDVAAVNVGFDNWSSSQPKDALPSNNILPPCVTNGDTGEMELTLDSISLQDNRKLNLLNRQESSRDDSFKLQDINDVEHENEHMPENKTSATLEVKHLEDSAKDVDSEKQLLAQSSLNKNSNSIYTAAENESVLYDDASLRGLDTVEKQLNFLNAFEARIFQKFSKNRLLSENDHTPSQESSFFNDIDGRHELLLEQYTIACKKEIEETESLTPNRKELYDKCLDEENGNFSSTEISSEEACWTRISSESNVGFPDSFTYQELDEFGLPLFTGELCEHVENVDVEMPLIYERINKDEYGTNECDETVDTGKDLRNISNGSFDHESLRNETSTPIPEEKCRDLNMEYLNFSAGSLNELSEGDECRIALKDSLVSHEHSLLADVNDKDGKTVNLGDLKVFPSESMDKDPTEDSSIIEDWEECAAEVSKNYDQCISMLEEIDSGDEVGENLNKTLSNRAVESGDISSKNLEPVDAGKENDDLPIMASEMDLTHMLKELDDAISTQLNGTIEPNTFGSVVQNSQLITVEGLKKEISKKYLSSFEKCLQKEIDMRNNYVVMPEATFDENTVNTASVIVKQVFPSTPNEKCSVATTADVDNHLESNLVSPTAIHESTHVDTLNNAQENNEQGHSLNNVALPDQNIKIRIDKELDESVLQVLSSNDMCNAVDTSEVDNGLLSEGAASSIGLDSGDSTPVNSCKNNMENIVPECTLPFNEEMRDYEDNAKRNNEEFKELTLPQSSTLNELNVVVIHGCPTPEQVSSPSIFDESTTEDNSETVKEMAIITTPSMIENLFASEEGFECDSNVYEQVNPRSPRHDECITIPTEVVNDLVDDDSTQPLISEEATPIFYGGSNVQEMFEQCVSAINTSDVLLDKNHAGSGHLQASEESVSPLLSTNYECTGVQMTEINNLVSNLISESLVYKESITIDEATNKIQEIANRDIPHMLNRVANYVIDVVSNVKFNEAVSSQSPTLNAEATAIEVVCELDSMPVSGEKSATRDDFDITLENACLSVGSTSLLEEHSTDKENVKGNMNLVSEEHISLVLTNDVCTVEKNADEHDLLTTTIVYPTTVICNVPTSVDPESISIDGVFKECTASSEVISYEKDTESNSLKIVETKFPNSPSLKVNATSEMVSSPIICDASVVCNSKIIVEELTKDVPEPSFTELVTYEDGDSNINKKSSTSNVETIVFNPSTEQTSSLVISEILTENNSEVIAEDMRDQVSTTSFTEDVANVDSVDDNIEAASPTNKDETIALNTSTTQTSSSETCKASSTMDNSEAVIVDMDEQIATALYTEELTNADNSKSNIDQVTEGPGSPQSLSSTSDEENLSLSEQTSPTLALGPEESAALKDSDDAISSQGACESPNVTGVVNGSASTNGRLSKSCRRRMRRAKKKQALKMANQ